jgi:hypothetical protein
MAIQDQIRAYKEAFYKDNARGEVVYVPSLNEWFAKCDITRNGKDVTLHGRIEFFESDPFTIMPELPNRLNLAMEAAGHKALQIAIEPTKNKIIYSFKDGEDLPASIFLVALRQYVKDGIKLRRAEDKGAETAWIR